MIVDKVKQLEETLFCLYKALSATTTMEVNGVFIDQRMFGQLETLNIGDNSSVVINQSIVLTVEAQEKLGQALEMLKEFREYLPSEDNPMDEVIQGYKKLIVMDALVEAKGSLKNAAKIIGATERSVRYCISKGGDAFKQELRKKLEPKQIKKEND